MYDGVSFHVTSVCYQILSFGVQFHLFSLQKAIHESIMFNSLCTAFL